MSLNKNPDERLLFSELTLAAIPKKKFQLDSWSSIDLFMDYAAELFGFTVKMLIRYGYLDIIEEQKTPVRFLGIRYSTRIDYLIHHNPKSMKGIELGWLEEKILDQFKSPQINQLSEVVYRIFNDLFQKEHGFVNPGKVFILQLLNHQKLNRFLVEEKSTLLSKQITITANDSQTNNSKEAHVYVNESDQQFIQIIEIISRKLHLFQDLD